MTFYYSRLVGSGAPFTLKGGVGWTEKAPATLGQAHYDAMCDQTSSTLKTLSDQIQGDFNEGNRDEESARKGIMVSQTPDYNLIGGGDPSPDGFGYDTNLTTSACKVLPQNTNYMSWYPVAARPWAIGDAGGSAGTSTGDRSGAQAHGYGVGGQDLNAITFTKAAWDACRDDVQEWLDDIEFVTGSNPALTMMTLESFDEGRGIFWQTDPPYLEPWRHASQPSNDKCYYDWASPNITVSWTGQNMTTSENIGTDAATANYLFFIGWLDSVSGSNLVTTSASRAFRFTANTGNTGSIDVTANFTDGGENVWLMIKRNADGALRQCLTLRESIA